MILNEQKVTMGQSRIFLEATSSFLLSSLFSLFSLTQGYLSPCFLSSRPQFGPEIMKSETLVKTGLETGFLDYQTPRSG